MTKIMTKDMSMGILEEVGEELIPESSIISSREKRGIKRTRKRSKKTNKSLKHYQEKHAREAEDDRVKRYTLLAEEMSRCYKRINEIVLEMSRG